MEDLKDDINALTLQTATMTADIADLAACIESVIAAALVAERDPAQALALLRAAQTMAAAIRTGGEIPETDPID